MLSDVNLHVNVDIDLLCSAVNHLIGIYLGINGLQQTL